SFNPSFAFAAISFNSGTFVEFFWVVAILICPRYLTSYQLGEHTLTPYRVGYFFYCVVILYQKKRKIGIFFNNFLYFF
ncbi:MAG TPA: hypothetical protein PKL57_17270, partial [Candidatus Wallbacteria bacterium]|nr:hypothetical protein [Candidatus Wallbacteria bacterium]